MADPINLYTFDEKTAKEIARFVATRRGQKPNIRRDVSARNKGTTGFVAAKVTSIGAVGSVVTHAWSEQRWDATAGEWMDVPDGAAGYTDQQYLINHPDASIALEVGEIVIAMRFEDPDFDPGGDELLGEIIWVKMGSGSLPIPQYQYQVFQAVSQSQIGADWVRAHDLI